MNTYMHKERHHVVITGVGRSGTTFLMQILTHLNLPTGYNANKFERHIDKNANAGLERNLRGEDSPYIVKDPVVCNYIDQLLEMKHVKLDHVYIPIRNLEDSANSRISIAKNNNFQPSKGGLWKTSDPEDQANVLSKMLFKLLVGLSHMDVPVTFLNFPRIVTDSKYLYEKLSYLLKDITYEDFEEVFNEVANPSLTFKNKI